MGGWIARILAPLVLIAGSLAAAATPPTPLPPDVYGRLPAIDLMRVSPSGERIAYVTVKGANGPW